MILVCLHMVYSALIILIGDYSYHSNYEFLFHEKILRVLLQLRIYSCVKTLSVFLGGNMHVPFPGFCFGELYQVAQKIGTVDFSGICSDQQLSFFTLLDRASFPHYNNTKIIKFGWELFILWVISYGLSFSGFTRFPEFRGMINDRFSSTCANTY